MPLDLNTVDVDELTSLIAHLPGGRGIMTEDGLVVRRPLTAPGFDCGVGAGGFGERKARTPREAAEYLLKQSAQATNSKSLGGATSYGDYDKALEDVRRGNTEPAGPSPALKALRRLANNADLHSYRTRAQMARDALKAGNVAKAVRQVEAILEHAARNGRVKDVERASAALKAISEHHEVTSFDRTTDSKVDVRIIDGKNYVFQDGVQKAGPLPRRDAENFKSWLEREVAKAEDQAAIAQEVADDPVAVLHEDAA